MTLNEFVKHEKLDISGCPVLITDTMSDHDGLIALKWLKHRYPLVIMGLAEIYVDLTKKQRRWLMKETWRH